MRKASHKIAFGAGLEKRFQTRLWQERYQEETIKNLRTFVPNIPKARVVEIGSGLGGRLVRLQQEGINILGVEFNPDRCQITRLRGARYGIADGVVTGIAEALPIKDNAADVVIAYEVLEHVFDPIEMLREIRRILSPDGIAFITAHNRWTLFDHHFGLWGISYMPRGLADALLLRLGKGPFTRRSGVQLLSEMHYYSWGKLNTICAGMGFSLMDVREQKLLSRQGISTRRGVERKALEVLRSSGLLRAVYRLYRRTVADTYHVVLTNGRRG